jgi:hypothetical protein
MSTSTRGPLRQASNIRPGASLLEMTHEMRQMSRRIEEEINADASFKIELHDINNSQQQEIKSSEHEMNLSDE